MNIILEAPDSFLWEIYLWGLAIIRGIQKFESPALTALMRVVSFLGTEGFYIPLILLILWGKNPKRGFRLGILLLLSAWINGFCKELLAQPRPFDLDSALGLAFEPTYGFPSGHAQNSLVFWIALLSGKNLWTLIPIILIAFSRLYLGVHFPTDILGGWLLGGALLLGDALLGRRIGSFFRARESAGIRIQALSAAALAFCMNASGADPNLGGMMLGFWGGYILWNHKLKPRLEGETTVRIPQGTLNMVVRWFMGIAGALLIYFGLRLLLPGEASMLADLPSWGENSPYRELGRFIRYGLLGLWASGGAPALFQRIGLGDASKDAEASPAEED